MTTAFEVRKVEREHLEALLPLIGAYQQFYGREPNVEKNRAHFGAIVDDASRGVLFAAYDPQGNALGFATLYFVPSSLSAGTSVTFNDLYTTPEARGLGAGVGIALKCFEHARSLGYKSIGWLTSPSNRTAQRIYDFTHATRSDWVMYDLSLA